MSAHPHIKPGASRRLEIHPVNFTATTYFFTTEEVGELLAMLMAEAALRPIPETKNADVASAFAERRVFSRICGSFGRAALALAVRREVYERDGGCCQYCGVSVAWGDYECDHVQPVSKGGSDDLTNLVASCEPCNRSKGAKLLSEWKA